MSARALVLYDGVCGLCDFAVQWLLRHDRRAVLTFAPLQGETARPYLAAASDSTADGGLGTLVLVERDEHGAEQVLVRSRAIFRILRRMGGPWSILAVLRVAPVFLTDALYRFVSRKRRKWFGQLEACRLPDAAMRARFLP